MEENNVIIPASKEQEEKPINPEIINKIENYKNIINKLKELISIIKGGHKLYEEKKNILQYINFPEIFPFDKLKNNILDSFNVKTIKELFNYLLNEINIIYNKDKNILNNEEEIQLREKFYKMIEKLNYFISPSIIFIDDNKEEKEKALDYFKKWIIKDNILFKNMLKSYINVFGLFYVLQDFYSINRQILLGYEGLKKILYLIDILQLQYIFPFKYIINNKRILILNGNNIIYDFYQTYNTSLNELYSLSDYIIQFKENKLSPYTIDLIINDIKIRNPNNISLISFIIEKLMIIYSYSNIKNYKEKEMKEILFYYIIIINNINNLSKSYIIKYDLLNEVLEKYIKEKDYDKVIYFFSNIKDYNNINKYIKNNHIIEELFKSTPFEKFISICQIIKNNKTLINYLLNTLTIKNAVKLIKVLNLKDNEYDKIFDEITINNFFYYKINTCLDDSFDILLDFALINYKTFNICLKLLLKNLYKKISIDKNNIIKNDDCLPLNEEEKNNNDISNNNDKNNRNNFKDIMKFFLKENEERKKNDEELLNIKKEKILTLYHFAKIKGYNLSRKNQYLFDKEFKNDDNIINLNYNKYIPEDKCEPHNSECIKINLKTQKIIFVDDIKILKDNLKYFRNSKYIGIDSEWSLTSFNVNNIETASILQLCNYCEGRILIIDLIKMKNNKEFFNLFEQNFKYKIFIGFDFNKNDIEQFFDELQKMFKEVEIIDLIDLYQNKYLEKAPSLKIMCEKILGKKMCKYEQCSNWENRPLKKSQLHYAAFDAIVCISLYKVLSSINA